MRSLSLALLLLPTLAQAAPPKPLITGLKNPESVAVTSDGRVFVSIIGERNTDGDGSIIEIVKGEAKTIASGLDDPKGLIAVQQTLFVTDKTRVRRIDTKTGAVSVWVDEPAFPQKPLYLNDICADERGTLYVSDMGDRKGSGGAIFRIGTKPTGKGKPPERGPVSLVADGTKFSWLKAPNGVTLDSLHHLLIVDFITGELHRLRLSDNHFDKVAEGFVGGDGLAFDRFGRLSITSWTQGKAWCIPRPGVKPILVLEGLESAADHCVDFTNKQWLIPDMKAGTITAISTQPPGWEVDETPLQLQTVVAFENAKWTGWDSSDDTGRQIAHRPILLTHAGDGSKRTFVATQQGVIHIMPEEAIGGPTKVFLTIEPKVLYKDNENEQGLLGLAFHPQYRTTGEFFVFYTDKTKKFENVVSRFRVSKDDPNKADPSSEEELMRITHKHWNHDGGTLAFGPDGYLYIVLGDGGSGNDPDDHGQALNTILGKILRIDVNKKGTNTPYAIPADNPFIGVKDAKPEIYAYGVRNPWRLSFDRQTGQGWFGEVGQNLWEEINLLQKGGNYGWRRREALHPFWVEGVGENAKMIDPIWEYDHVIGKSITGGHVYRGKQFPELQGHYLYADYVTSKLWALKYDDQKKRVVANRPIKDRMQTIMSFGEDEQGEVYLMTYSTTGKGISKYSRTK